jgi:hypothetical protein
VYPEWRRTYTRNQEHQAIKKEEPFDTDTHQHTQKRTRSSSPTGPRKSAKSQSNKNVPRASLPSSTSEQFVTHNTELLEAPNVHPELFLPTGENVSEAPVNCPSNPSAPSTSLEMCVGNPTPSLPEGETVGVPSVPYPLSVPSPPSALSVPSVPPALSVPLSATSHPPDHHPSPSLAISPIPTSSSDHLSINRPRQKLKIINSL